ncbi:MAG: putative Ig domain-containing protein, partial [Candidatus Eisenbacteria bacterium]|nr:putative Ig domain-containing protein [Candidatus Eisenbacteria bacterium]
MSPRTSRCILERIGRVALLAALPVLLAASAYAGTFYSQGSLDATALTSWNSVRAGGGTQPADFASGDVFVVQNAHAMTQSASWTLSGAGAQLQIETGGSLLVSSGVTLSLAGPLSVAGTLELASGTGDLEVGGDWSVDAGGTFTPNGRTVRLNGTADQDLASGGDAFGGLEISKASGQVVLTADATVNGTLTLSGGNVATGSNTLVLAATGSVSRTSGHVVGQLRKSLAAGASSATFEIGDASHYTPLSVAGEGGGFATAFDLVASTSEGDHAAISTSGLRADHSANRTWTLAATGYTGGTFGLTCNFDAADLDAGATPSRFVARRYSGSAWVATTTGVRTGTSTGATGLAAFGDFAAGEQAIDHYDVSAASPQTTGTPFTTTVTARDLLNETVPDDNTTSVTMTSSGAAEFDADGNGTFGDNAKSLTGGAVSISTRDLTAETVTLIASDGNSKTGSRAGLVVLAPLSITTTTLPNGTVGSAYSQTLAATGGTAPYGSWAVTVGSLPAGLSLDSGSGLISGTPATAETQAFTVRVVDAASDTATQALSITV